MNRADVLRTLLAAIPLLDVRTCAISEQSAAIGSIAVQPQRYPAKVSAEAHGVWAKSIPGPYPETTGTSDPLARKYGFCKPTPLALIIC